MTPTAQEKLWLKDYLYQIMEYQETYEEVYDHMVLAVANEPKQEFFESVVTDIIDRDFGGTNGLYDLEQYCKQAVEITSETQYAANFKHWFTTPLVIITATIFVCLLRIQYLNQVLSGILLLLFIVLLVSPGILTAVRRFRLAYKHSKVKPSLKDRIFRQISFKPNRTLFRLFCIVKALDLFTRYVLKVEHWPSEHAMSLNVLYVLATIILVLMIVHILSVTKMLLVEIKTGIIANKV